MIHYPVFSRLLFTAFVIMIAQCFQLLHAQQSSTVGDIARTISYQGMLTDANGAPVTSGLYAITVTLYADKTGSEPVWTDTYHSDVTGGVFNLYLGSGQNPLPEPGELNTSLWVGTSINGAKEMRPLTPLAASPYALNVADESITTAKLFDGSVTADKVSMNYVAGIRINGEEIAGNGTTLDIRSGENLDIHYDDVTESLIIGATNALGSQKGDTEKGAEVLDITYVVSNNWLGRDPALGGVNHPFYTVPNTTSSQYNTLGGGYLNNIMDKADSSALYGGSRNIVGFDSDCAFLGAGCGNLIRNFTAGNVLVGGIENTISDNTEANVIAGGSENMIGDASQFNAIGGGTGNTIAVGGNPVNAGTIGGGGANLISFTGDYGVIGGGFSNIVRSLKATVGGGEANLVEGDYGTVAGGTGNRVFSDAGIIGGGLDNTVALTSEKSFIGGGNANSTESSFSAIGGGATNTIGTAADHSFIGGGNGNSVSSLIGTISGGSNNQISTSADASTIGGGASNSIAASRGVVGGGESNLIPVGSVYSTIGGGESNRVVGSYSTIPGGDRLRTVASYAQVAVGFYNDPRGAVPVQPNASQLTDDPLFMVGNGNVSSLARSNAFEVSYNGHSTVYHLNGPAVPAIRGATYTDNVNYAWGQVNANGDAECDFGVASVTQIGAGQYEVVLNLTDPLGNLMSLECYSVTATVRGDECGFATVMPIAGSSPTTFRVFTRLADGSCEQQDLPFMFQVTGRPQ